MSAITTHVLDTVPGKPATGVAVQLEKHTAAGWVTAGQGVTDSDGRCRDLCHDGSAGEYRLTFAVGAYFAAQERVSIYGEVSFVVSVVDGSHYHLPLLLSDHSFTTYRGS